MLNLQPASRFVTLIHVLAACMVMMTALGRVHAQCAVDAYSILTSAQRQLFTGSLSSSVQTVNQRLVAVNNGETYILRPNSREVRILSSLASLPLPVGTYNPEQIIALQGEVYVIGEQVWKLTNGQWVTVGSFSRSSISALTVYRGQLAAAVFGDVYLFDGTLWRNIFTGQSSPEPAFDLGGNIHDLIEFNGTLYAATGPSRVSTTTPSGCVWRYDPTGWQAVRPELAGTATSLSVYQDQLFVGGVMRLPDTIRLSSLYAVRLRGDQTDVLVERRSPSYSYSSTLVTLARIGTSLAIVGVPETLASTSPIGNNTYVFDGISTQPLFPQLASITGAWMIDGELTVSGRSNGTQEASLYRVGIPPAPRIMLAPVPFTTAVPVNRNAPFVIEAVTSVSGGQALIQWRRNGQVLRAGSTNPWGSVNVVGGFVSGTLTRSTLTVTRVRAEDAGVYDAVISSPCGVTISDPITLRVCVADFNASGRVTSEDVFAFLSAWFAGNQTADVDARAGVSTGDLFEFIGAYVNGCP
jgi:hypothetical protein